MVKKENVRRNRPDNEVLEGLDFSHAEGATKT
jgi:hypothetical protein